MGVDKRETPKAKGTEEAEEEKCDISGFCWIFQLLSIGFILFAKDKTRRERRGDNKRDRKQMPSGHV